MFFDAIKSIFEDKLTEDVREPLYMFGDNYGFYLPSLSFWIQLSLLLSVQSLVAAFIGALVHQFLIPRRGTSFAFIFGFGVVMPTLIYAPFFLIQTLDLQNRMLMMSASSCPVLLVFKTFEAIAGTSPKYVENSIQSYIVYYASFIEYEMDAEKRHPKKPNAKEVLSKAKDLMSSFFICSCLFSLFLPSNFTPMKQRVGANTIDHRLIELFHPSHLFNNFIAALLYCTWLVFGCDLVSLVTLILGAKTKDPFDNPLFQSRSPSDFWGRRWNRMVHGFLKRGIYKPALTAGFSKNLAVFAVFIVSGLVHEWVWAGMFFCSPSLESKSECFEYVIGKSTGFFCWNGILIMLESLLGDSFLFQMISTSLPRQVISILVLCSALPLSHLYTGDWIEGGFYKALNLGLPTIK